MIHTASLLHDDVVDESDSRRGLLSVNAQFGNKVHLTRPHQLLRE
jgi:geranylgeranyl pyrophosphate synthase